MSNRTIFFNVAWMTKYRGLDEELYAGGSWPHKHEPFNFLPFRSKYYGYGQPQGNRINLTRLNAKADAAYVDGVRVVWVAKRPGFGLVVVGWYRNARLYATPQQSPRDSRRWVPGNNRLAGYITVASKHKAILLKPDDRVFRVPKDHSGGGFGHTVGFFDSEVGTRFLKQFLAYAKKVEAGAQVSPPEKGKPSGGGWQQDLEKRLAVEKAAMDAVAHSYASSYQVEYVHNEKLGWDLEAAPRSGNAPSLLVEVKGCSGSQAIAQLTPNEYERMTSRKYRQRYRLCVVTNALDKKKRRVQRFAWHSASKSWRDEDDRNLLIEKVTATWANVAG